MSLECPSCGTAFGVSFKESLLPYSMTFSIRPDAGRAVQAKTVGGVLTSLQSLLVEAGENVGHGSLVHLIDARVDEDMSVHLTVAVSPFHKEADEAPA